MNNKQPILFITFKRQFETLQVLNKILEYKPEKIYISSDAGRDYKEQLVIDELRKEMLKKVGNIPLVFKKFNSINLGVSGGVSSAIDWFFEHEEQGIILEDDCLPNKTFFNFMETALLKYKLDKSISHISGFNCENNQNNVSTYLSNYCMIWGWATWKDRWFKLSEHEANWNNKKLRSKFRASLSGFTEWLFWKDSYNRISKKTLDTWDYQFYFYNIINDRKSIVAPQNFIRNIGFGENASNTSGISQLSKVNFSKLKSKEISYDAKTSITYDQIVRDLFFGFTLMNFIKKIILRYAKKIRF